jgi:2-amino-4-hydroxy-6-hydroxymethyldihydropteridine diphosphokinase
VDRIPLTCVVNSSHVYESEPALGLTESVLNAVIELRTELAPLVLLDHLLQVEDELGRVRPADGSHGPRTIDLDLIWYDGETHQGTKLRLPHPGIGERDFVIVPLDDLVHDGERFLRYAGIEVAEPEDRIGRVTVDLGPLQ